MQAQLPLHCRRSRTRNVWHRRIISTAEPGDTTQCAAEQRVATALAVRYINLKRRSDRRMACEAFLEAAGLAAVSERVDALDGRELWDARCLASRCKDAVTRRALSEDTMHGGWVMGGDFTPGAAALCATTRSLLLQEANCSEPPAFLLVLEDDVQLANDARPFAVRELLLLLAGSSSSSSMTERSEGNSADDDGGAAARAASWDVLLLGTHPESEIDDAVVAPLPAALGGSLRRVGTFFGLFGYVVRTSSLRRVVDALFPCDEQLDSALAEANAQGRLSVLHVGTPLLASAKSHPGQTDIQRMDVESFVAHQKEVLCSQGRLPPAVKDHPDVQRQLVEAYRRQYGEA